MDAQHIWQAAQGELQLQMTRATYDTWLRSTSAISYEDGTLIVAVENAYAKDWLENRLLGTIKRTLAGVVGRSVEVRFMVRSRKENLDAPLPLEKALPVQDESPSIFNLRYTFESFIVGNSNRLAHAAAYAVATRPAGSYNPLFLYGGVGLGKTHLLHAIGHVPLKSGHRVLYISSETFTNDLINSIRNGTTAEFRTKYRNIDVLLVDDIQFIAGKESTQEEFFHTFNTLYTANRQIVISSDRPPKAILTLEERLRSRFEWGLIADIQPPDLEMRIAILRAKAESHALCISPEVIDLLAHKIQSNIRELEGSLNRVVAYAQLLNRHLSLEVAEAALRDLSPHREAPSLAKIIEAVCRFYNLSPDDLKSPRRTKRLVLPRQVFMYLAREEGKASLPTVGQLLGGRDHTTIIHGSAKISSLVEHDNNLRHDILAIKDTLYKV